MKGTLYIQRDDKARRIEKPEGEGIECEINLGKNGSAIAGVVGKAQLVAEPLIRARVEFISANGLFISGLVEDHHGGLPTVRFQEWWFVPIVAERGKSREAT